MGIGVSDEIKSDGKIESIINDSEYKEMKIEDHPDYSQCRPFSDLFYLDYKYGSTSSTFNKP